MLSDGPKRIVVIKDINSNMIEEAILILKNGSAAVGEGSDDSALKKVKKVNPDFLLKEAQVIIEDYLKENKTCFQAKTKREKRKKVPYNKLKISTIINLALFGSVIILLLMITKMI